ncbi:10919_t:CDS:2 [Funneliformis geosporum]|uniref:1023_t:CDS:1 n=1 Tax=Funneliformis geosporum TaxID=1117311 RepID=A0A9W4SBR1_9GLOM|nr:1023_t:CDS:2 [Funneliformis geosporum]CAI2163501.1 10919_t:CDS:2 [Funneliformis geosporum]
MFKSKPTPTSATLSFTDILSDLTRLQTYHQTHTGEKIDVLEIIKTEKPIEDSKGPTQINTMTKTLLPTFLNNTSDASLEVISSTYDIITNFIRVNEQLFKTRKNLDGLGSEIEVFRKELCGTIDTLNNSDFVNEEGKRERDISIEEKL